eukprot:TRINITY_DN2882_c0_g1_i2.p1 TRINITY_DN2882_c0_g1~~TRINITY_DN2882_c0_g1_i2.p1  ORF type:complete len:378 (-),score=111.69 TRINITY_DN2882_c0_g1_i2:33-1133(-)
MDQDEFGVEDTFRIHVSNLPSNITEGDLDKVFQESGKIKSIQIIRNGGECYAFIHFCTEEARRHALQTFNLTTIKGKLVTAKSGDTNTHLYIGNIPNNVTITEIEELVHETLKNSTSLISCDLKEHGYGFLEFGSARLASDSLEKLQNLRVGDVELEIKEAKEKNKISQKIVNVSTPHERRDVFVDNLPIDITEAQVKSIFGEFGTILRLEMKSSKKPQPRSFAFIEFETAAEANAARVEMSDQLVEGRRVKTGFVKDKSNQAQNRQRMQQQQRNYNQRNPQQQGMYGQSYPPQPQQQNYMRGPSQRGNSPYYQNNDYPYSQSNYPTPDMNYQQQRNRQQPQYRQQQQYRQQPQHQHHQQHMPPPF